MTTNAPAKYSEQTFESIKHVNEYGEEYWLARELQPVLEYTQWRRFADVIERAKLACRNSGYNVEDHFADVGKTIEMPKNAHKIVPDYMLSRYACYLIVMNGDPRKEVIAVGQTYFAVKARQQELIERYDALAEDQKRLAIRSEMIAHNKSLAQAAKQAGVETPQDYAIFQNKGYQGLYGGLGAKEIHARKGLGKNQKILDHWAAPNLRPICSAPPRPMRSSAAMRSAASRPRTTPTMKSAGRSGRPSGNWAGPCRKICPPPKRASRRSSGSRIN